MSRKNFSQQFPNPEQVPEDIIPPEDEVYHTPPEDIFPVFLSENEPVNTPPVDLQNNQFNFSEEYLWELEQDEAILRDIRENEAREEAARLE